ncbi:sulfotransferase family 2 domain-containing protein [Propylenella binzhouense]|nr:sulfotransferase family 2 domain-containing protein [Propylenella binzhouense]
MTEKNLRHRLVQAIVYADELPFVYVQNPKVACTTIKTALWEYVDAERGTSTFGGSPHARAESPFVNILRNEYDFEAFSAKPIVTMVRNPYARAVSAYENKIGYLPRRLDQVWNRFCEIHAVDASLTKAEFGFVDFLRTLATGVDPAEFDQHFRPQSIGLFYDSVDYTFIGRVEEADATFKFMNSLGLRVENKVLGATKKTKRTEDYYDDEAVELVKSIYADDFRLFGYSTELSELREFGDFLPPERPGELIDLIRERRSPTAPQAVRSEPSLGRSGAGIAR